MPSSRITADDGTTYIDFIKLGNPPIVSGLELQPFVREGISGTGLMKVGNRGRPFTLVGFRDSLSVTTAISECQTFIDKVKGKTITIHDMAGNSYANYVCLNAEILMVEPTLLSSGGKVSNSKAVYQLKFDILDPA